MFDEVPYYRRMAEYCLSSYRADLDTSEVMARFVFRRAEAGRLLSKREYDLLRVYIMCKSYSGNVEMVRSKNNGQD